MMGLVAELAGTNRASIERQNRIKTAHDDFGFFCRTYLEDYFFEDAADYQKLLYEVANSRTLTQEQAERLRPFVKVLWCVLTGRARYVLLIGASGDAASENLSNIKTEIEENEAVAADFGELQGGAWTNRRLELANGTCIQCKGSGASMRGTRFRQYRPDLIVIDDVLKDDAINSFTQRNKIHRWLKRVVFNLGKTAFIIWVNTIFHNDGTAEVPVAQDTETGILYVLPSFADTCTEQRTVGQMMLLHRHYH